jgi:hypothetical protein
MKRFIFFSFFAVILVWESQQHAGQTQCKRLSAFLRWMKKIYPSLQVASLRHRFGVELEITESSAVTAATSYFLSQT